MVDILALAISHGLLLIAAWRLIWRDDLDSEGGEARKPRRRGQPAVMRVNRPEGSPEDGAEDRDA